MRALRLAATCLVAASLAPPSAHACATCGCGDPTLTAMGVEKPYENRVRLSLEERFGGGSMGDPSVYVERFWTLRSTVGAAWSPHRRLTLVTLVPLVAVWAQAGSPQATASGAAAWRSGAGLGDVELSGRVVLFRDRAFSPRHLVSLLGGIALPTGPRAYDTTGYPLPDDDQPGSGAFTPLVGLSYGWFGERFALFSSVGYRYSTPGWHGYQRGMTLGATAGIQFQPFARVALAAAADFRWQSPDTLASGIAVPNNGGASLALTPSLLLALLPDWLIKLSVQVHVADWLVGVQTESNVVMLSTVVDLN